MRDALADLTMRTDIPSREDHDLETDGAPADAEDDLDSERAIRALRLSHKAGFEALRLSAIERVKVWDSRGDVPSALKLRLATECNVPDWYKPAVRSLLSQPYPEIDKQDVGALDAHTFKNLLKWRYELERCRTSIALDYPKIRPSASCGYPTQCPDCAIDCWKGIADFAETPLSLFIEDLPYRLRAAGVCDDCADHWSDILQLTDIGEREEDLIEKAAASMFAEAFGAERGVTST